MNKSKFAILFLSVFVMLFSVSCGRSSGRSVSPPGPTPPTPPPTPPVPPPVNPGFYLIPPFSSPTRETSPRFIIKDLPDRLVTVSLYRGPLPGSGCEDPNLIFIKKLSVDSSKSEITFDNLGDIVPSQDGPYKFFVKIEGNQLPSTCLQLTYILDNTIPKVVNNTFDRDPLENDDTPRMSKTWSWTCDDTTDCEYRWFIDDTPLSGTSCGTHTFSATDTYSNAFSATKTGGDGKFCIHIQARDQVDLESEVQSVYATLDNTPPVISSVTVPSGSYAGGDQLDITMTFNEPVTVTGTPQVALTFDGGGTKQAQYYKGSGSRELVFRYIVARTDSDSDGIEMTDSLDLNSGSVKDVAGNSVDSLQTFTLPTNLTLVLVNGDGPNVVISKTDLEVNEKGGTGTYTVKLNKVPSQSVTVNLRVADSSVATVSPASLTFEVDNSNGKIWSSPQTVTVTGVDDLIDNDVGGHPQRTTHVAHSVTSTDADYNNIGVSSVEVESLDDDEIGSIQLSVNPERVDEHDDTSQNSQADNSETVTVTARFQGSSSGGQPNGLVRLSDDLILSMSVRAGTAQAMDFSPVPHFEIRIPSGNSTATGTFNLTVIDDNLDEVHETLEVRGTTPLGLTVNPATLTINDNDGVGVMLSGLMDDDTPRMSKTWRWSCAGGISCEYRYKVDDTPLSGTSCGTYIFPPSENYSNISPTATKSGGDGKFCIHVQAKDSAGVESSVITVYATLDNTPPVISSVNIPEKTYAGGDQLDITVTFSESVTVTGTPQIALTFDGGGRTQTKQARYNSGSDSGELVFRYTIIQTDIDSDGVDLTSPLDLNSGSIKDAAGNSLTPLTFTPPVNLARVLVEGDKANVIVSATQLQFNENSGTGTYTVGLNRAPSQSVTVELSSADTSVATVSPAFLTFELDNSNGKIWSSPQTVTVTGVNDDIDNDVGGNPQRTTSLAHNVTSFDTDYHGLNVNQIPVTSLDDDDVGSIRLTLKKTSESIYSDNLSVDEHDPSSQLEQADNTENVEVHLEFHESLSGGSPNPSVVLGEDVIVGVSVRPGTAQETDFTAVSDFKIPITRGLRAGTGSFTLTLTDDAVDDDNETLEINGIAVFDRQSVEVPSGFQVSSALITILDNDEKGVEVLPLSLLVHEGSQETYTVRLQSAPVGPVVISLGSANTSVATVSPTSLTFEVDDSNNRIWSSPQTVTVTGVNDNTLTGSDRSTRITHTASGNDYNGFGISDVSVTVPDRENKLAITHAESILEDNQDDYSISGSCVSRGGSVSVQVGPLSPVDASCSGSSWSVTGFDASGIAVNGRVTITATQTVSSDTSTESVEVDRCISSEDSSFPKWICSYDELKEIEKKDISTRYYILGVNIDATDSWSEGEAGCGAYNGTAISRTDPCSGWEPIDLSGGFDGRGHSIENLYIHSSQSYVGFFGQSRVSVSNLHLKNVRVHSTARGAMVGAITGRNYGNIEGCSVTGVLSSAANGITGALSGDIQGNILNSYADAQVSAKFGEDTIVGGLVGLLRGGGRFIMSSYSRGSVQISGGLGEAGGLAGWLVASSLYWTYSESSVSGGIQSGGLIGDMVGMKHISVSHSYSLGRGSPDDPLSDVFSVGYSSQLFWDTQTSGTDTSEISGATGLETVDMQAACANSETTGICALGDGFQFTLDHYPKLKKCSVCDPGNPVFNDELLDGQSSQQ